MKTASMICRTLLCLLLLLSAAACGDGHDDGIAALQKYYSKLEAYTEFTTDPSGNLMNYRSNHANYKNDIAELKSTAEFDK